MTGSTFGQMSDLGDNLRDFAAAVDKRPEWTAAGVIVAGKEVYSAFAERDAGAQEVGVALYNRVVQAPPKEVA